MQSMRRAPAGRALMVGRWVSAVIAVGGLAVDVWTHWDLASTYDPVRTSTLSQGDLFRVEAVLAGLAAVLVLVRRTFWTAVVVVLVAGGGLAALLLYRWVNVGQIGPLPNMYEPVWYGKKEASATGEAVAAMAGLVLAGLTFRDAAWPRRLGRTARPRVPAH